MYQGCSAEGFGFSSVLQFVDDTTIYQSSKVCHIDTCVTNLEKDIQTLKKWSDDSNLVFNLKKTKTMLFSTGKMSRVHSLANENIYQLICGKSHLEREKNMKLLGITFNENLSWKHHIMSVLSNCYGTLRKLKQIKRCSPFYIKKNLVEALILTKIDYGSIIYQNCPIYLKKRLQRLQNAAAGFVLGRYASVSDVLDLNWLPIIERMDFIVAKMTFNALRNTSWPQYLQVRKRTIVRNLRSSLAASTEVERYNENNTFQDQAAKIYNNMPIELRDIECYSSFVKDTKKYFIDKAKARTLE